ncbi:MAG: nuclear transport factor 2 family protein [Candidatus Bathyarchaeia archaeon]|jgi:ketosteroid isomerase-like protein
MTEAKQASVPEEKLESIIREYETAFEKMDVEKTLSFFTDDVIWTAPEGTFNGKDEARRDLTWIFQSHDQIKFRDAGVGIMVKGNKAVYQFVNDGVLKDGRRYETPGACFYEFVGEKIQRHTVMSDRLMLAKQAAKGFVQKWVVNTVVNATEKGLR